MESYQKNLINLPGQLNPQNVKTTNLSKLKGPKPDAVVVCGMGGSGLIGDILRDNASAIKLPVPVVTIKNDGLLPLPFERPLYLCTSFSGNTEETLNCLKEALKTKKKYGVAVITGAGGKMRKIAERENLTAASFDPGDLTPREASGYMYYGVTKILHGIFPRIVVRDLSRTIKAANFASRGAALAKRLKGKNILVYSDQAFSALGYIWKISFNETGKNAAFANIYPEINHNEIVGYTKIRGPWVVLWLIDPSMKKKIKDKADFVARSLKAQGISSITIPLAGKGNEEKFWNGVALAGWTSLNLAKQNRVRPAETRVIDELKKRFT